MSDPSFAGIDRFRLDGRRAVVTGGARGIGRAIALALAGAGTSVTIADRDLTGAEATVAELAGLGGHAAALALDVIDVAAVGAAVLFLASDASSFMTGSVVTVDGGYTCW